MQIPADLVVNAMIVAMAAHEQSNSIIYQVGSSVRNPLRYSDLQDYGFRYFSNKPWIDKDGKPVKVGPITVLTSMPSFRRYMTLRYMLFLKVFLFPFFLFSFFFNSYFLAN